MRKQMCRRVSATLLLLILLPPLSSATADNTPIDTGRQTSLTIEYPCSNAAFSLYRVGDISGTGELSLSGDFRDYPLSLNQDEAGWRSLAQTLETYAVRDHLQPLFSGVTDESGSLTYPALPVGLYLITGQRCTMGGNAYVPHPFLICLPNLEAENGPWLYDVTASPKFDVEPESPAGESTSRKVLKLWANDGNGQQRPASIEVVLLRDGIVWDTVTLNDGNAWRHTWEQLDQGRDWRVAEKSVPNGYRSTIEWEGTLFVITNTYQGNTPPDPAKNLPQTGVLWWPVPLLACGGAGLFLMGWILRRRGENNA